MAATWPSTIYLGNIAALLHANNAHVILFVHPDQKGLVAIVEDATSDWPVTASICSLHTTNDASDVGFI
jgi:hypothetical protein